MTELKFAWIVSPESIKDYKKYISKCNDIDDVKRFAASTLKINMEKHKVAITRIEELEDDKANLKEKVERLKDRLERKRNKISTLTGVTKMSISRYKLEKLRNRLQAKQRPEKQ